MVRSYNIWGFQQFEVQRALHFVYFLFLASGLYICNGMILATKKGRFHQTNLKLKDIYWAIAAKNNHLANHKERDPID